MVVHEGYDYVELDKVTPGDTIKLKLVREKFVNELIDYCKLKYCKLITLTYGQFFIKSDLRNIRNSKLDQIIKII